MHAIEAIGRRPEDVREILLTHCHDDHRGGAAALVARTGARVLAHRADVPVDVDREIDDGDATEGDGVIVGVPGHTPGSIALHVPQLGVLFTGDTIAEHQGNPILGIFNVDRARAIDSLKKQAALEFEVACFGHGAPIVGEAGGKIRALAQSL